MLALVSAMLAADLSDPAWMAARMLASDESAGDSAAVAPDGSCLVGAGWRRGLVNRRSVGDVAPSRSGISTLVEDAEMLCLAEGNESGNKGVAR